MIPRVPRKVAREEDPKVVARVVTPAREVVARVVMLAREEVMVAARVECPVKECQQLLRKA